MNVRGKSFTDRRRQTYGKVYHLRRIWKNEYESYIIHPRNLIVKDGIICIPPYMTMNI
jgi:hypothetical protein